MAIDSESRRSATYYGNGLLVTFPFTFKVFAPEQVVAAITSTTTGSLELTYPADFSVFLNPDQDTSPGGSITLTTPLLSGYTITIKSKVPYNQLIELTNAGAFYPDVVNAGFDKVVIQIQQVLDLVQHPEEWTDLRIAVIAAALENDVIAAAVAANSASLLSSSTTTLTIGTGSKSLTVGSGKNYVVGMTVKIASTADGSNWMLGDVTAYNSSSGALVVSVATTRGAGSGLSDWTISQSPPGGALPGANTDITSLLSPDLHSATADTQALTDNSTKIATTAWAKAYTDAAAPIGLAVPFMGNATPANYIACPPSMSLSLDPAVYPDLFAAIGYLWSGGASSGNFSPPWVPVGFTLQANTVGLYSVGAVIAHSHAQQTLSGGSGQTSPGSASGANPPSAMTTPTGTTGTTANYAAAMGVKFIVRYK